MTVTISVANGPRVTYTGAEAEELARLYVRPHVDSDEQMQDDSIDVTLSPVEEGVS